MLKIHMMEISLFNIFIFWFFQDHTVRSWRSADNTTYIHVIVVVEIDCGQVDSLKLSRFPALLKFAVLFLSVLKRLEHRECTVIFGEALKTIALPVEQRAQTLRVVERYVFRASRQEAVSQRHRVLTTREIYFVLWRSRHEWRCWRFLRRFCWRCCAIVVTVGLLRCKLVGLLVVVGRLFVFTLRLWNVLIKAMLSLSYDWRVYLIIPNNTCKVVSNFLKDFLNFLRVA